MGAGNLPQPHPDRKNEVVEAAKQVYGALQALAAGYRAALESYGEVEKALARAGEGMAVLFSAVEAEARFRERADLFEEYAGVRSLAELQEKFPIARERERRFLELLRKKTEETLRANPAAQPLKGKVFAIYCSRFLARYSIPCVSRLPAAKAAEAEEWLAALPPLDFREFGPLASLIAARRAALGLSQGQAALMCGVARNTFAGWEAGKKIPSRGNVVPLAEFLDIAPSEVAALAEAQAGFRSGGARPGALAGMAGNPAAGTEVPVVASVSGLALSASGITVGLRDTADSTT